MEHVRLRPLAAGDVDQGLRAHMIGIYRTMALGLLLTAGVSLAVASTPALVAALFGTPLKWVAMSRRSPSCSSSRSGSTG